MKRIILYCVFFFALIVETSCGSRISNIESEKSALPQKMEGVKPEQKQAIRESLNITFEDALGNRNTRKNTYDYQNRLTEAVAKEKKTGRETVDTYSYNAYGDVATQDDTSFVYNDVSGQVTKETTKLTKNKDVVKNYSYDSAGNKSAFAVKVGDDTKLSMQYTYDGASKLTAVTDEDGKVVRLQL